MWRKIQRFLAVFVPAVLLLVYVGVMICMLNRWDSMVPVTLVPIWAWGALGALASLLSWALFRGPSSLVVFCLWLFSGIVFAEETHSLLRELGHSIDVRENEEEEAGPTEPVTLRIVHAHLDGDEADFRSLAALEPDILTIQAAPGQQRLKAFGEQLFGLEAALVINGDKAILARGEFIQTLAEPTSDAVHARLRTPRGTIIDITTLQLQPCFPTLDMWKPEAWEKLVAARLENRQHLRTSLGENDISLERAARIVSGGFRTPPGDDVFRPLETTGMIDTFAAEGTGWGNTWPGHFPLLRLDQIWVSENLVPLRCRTEIATAASHRTVVCDVEVQRD